jgi:hypothetical protein
MQSDIGDDFVQWRGDPPPTGRWPIRLIRVVIWGLAALVPFACLLAAHDGMHPMVALVLLVWSAVGLVGATATLEGDAFELHVVRLDAAGLHIVFSCVPKLADKARVMHCCVPWCEVRAVKIGTTRLDDSWSPAYYFAAEAAVPLDRRKKLELAAYGPVEWVEKGRKFADSAR